MLILNMNVLGNVNMMHINVRNSLLGGCRLNKEAGDAGKSASVASLHSRRANVGNRRLYRLSDCDTTSNYIIIGC